MTDRKLPIGNALDLGRALRAERRMRGWSQEELARKIGRDRKSIVALEKGDNVGIHVLMSVLMALGKGLEIRAFGRVEYERLQEIFGDEDED